MALTRTTIRGTPDGDSYDYAGNDQATFIIDGWEGDDAIAGGENADSLVGGAGADQVEGQGGSDTLEGGQGDDALAGGGGIDIYKFNIGDGHDLINAAGNDDPLDVLTLNPSIAAARLNITESGNDLVITVSESDSVTVENWFGNENNRLAAIDIGGLRYQVQSGTSGDDAGQALNSGLTTNKITIAGAGNDVITGRGKLYLPAAAMIQLPTMPRLLLSTAVKARTFLIRQGLLCLVTG